MIGKILTKVFGSSNDRYLKQLNPMVARINQMEQDIQPLDDAALVAKTGEFKQRLENGEPLDDLLPEAFAVVREAGKGSLVSAITMSSWLVVLFCIRVKLQR